MNDVCFLRTGERAIYALRPTPDVYPAIGKLFISKAIFDTATRGLCLRIGAGGTKSFCLVSGKQRTRVNIGKYPQLSLADARAECRRIIAERTLGVRTPGAVAWR